MKNVCGDSSWGGKILQVAYKIQNNPSRDKMGPRGPEVVDRLRRKLEAAQKEAEGLKNSYEEQRRRLDKVSDELDRLKVEHREVKEELEVSQLTC